MQTAPLVFLSFLALTVAVKLRNSSTSSLCTLCHYSCFSIKFSKVQPKTTGLEGMRLESRSKRRSPTDTSLRRGEHPQCAPSGGGGGHDRRRVRVGGGGAKIQTVQAGRFPHHENWQVRVSQRRKCKKSCVDGLLQIWFWREDSLCRWVFSRDQERVSVWAWREGFVAGR
jgi:hypothetical protein